MTQPTVGAPTGGAWCQAPDVAAVEGDDRHVVLDLAAPATPPRVLSGPAAAIWAAVDGTRDTAAVVAHVAAEFGAEPSDLEADVVAFLTQLQAEGLLLSPTGDVPGAGDGGSR